MYISFNIHNHTNKPMNGLHLHDLTSIIQTPGLAEAIAANVNMFQSTEITEESPNLVNLVTATMGNNGTNIGDTLANSLAEAADKKAKVLAATITTEAKKHAPLVASIICAACCCSVFGVLILATHIVAFIGLAHTQHIDLDPLCPPHYWDANIALLFMRFIVFALAGCALCASCAIRKIFCTAATIVCALVTVFSFAVADTVVTAQAWTALNCSVAVRAGRDADPLLMATGSIFVAIDWCLLLCVCSAACRACRVRAEVETAE